MLELIRNLITRQPVGAVAAALGPEGECVLGVLHEGRFHFDNATELSARMHVDYLTRHGWIVTRVRHRYPIRVGSAEYLGPRKREVA